MDTHRIESPCDVPGDIWWWDCQQAQFPECLAPETRPDSGCLLPERHRRPRARLSWKETVSMCPGALILTNFTHHVPSFTFLTSEPGSFRSLMLLPLICLPLWHREMCLTLFHTVPPSLAPWPLKALITNVSLSDIPLFYRNISQREDRISNTRQKRVFIKKNIKNNSL